MPTKTQTQNNKSKYSSWITNPLWQVSKWIQSLGSYVGSLKNPVVPKWPMTYPTPIVEPVYNTSSIPTINQTSTIPVQIKTPTYLGTPSAIQPSLNKLPANQTSEIANMSDPILKPFKALENILDTNNQQYANVMTFVDQETKWMLWNLRNNLLAINDQQQKTSDAYFKAIWDAQSKRMAEEQALAQSQWTRSWATPSAVNNTIAELSQKQLEDSLRIQEEKLKQSQALFDVYNNIEQNFLQNYANSTDKNVVNTYKEILGNKNQLLSSIAQMQSQMNQSKWGGWWSSNPYSSNPQIAQIQMQQDADTYAKQQWLTRDILWNYVSNWTANTSQITPEQLAQITKK